MHTFQPYPSEMLDINPFTKIGTEWMAVTAGDKDKVNTMTASWGTIGVLWAKTSSPSMFATAVTPRNS